MRWGLGGKLDRAAEGQRERCQLEVAFCILRRTLRHGFKFFQRLGESKQLVLFFLPLYAPCHPMVGPDLRYA